MNKKHFFSLHSIKAQKSGHGGSRTSITANEVSSLDGISLESLKLKKDSSLEPIWHPNANKIGYCLQGKALVTVQTPTFHDVYTVVKGDVFFIPQGNFHYITNIGHEETVIVFALSSNKPEELSISKAVHSLSPSAFRATFHTPPAFFTDLSKSKEKATTLIKNPIKKPPSYIASRYKFNIDDSNNYLTTAGGYLKAATKGNLPVLDGLGMFTFGLNDKGIVEPHWHTNAGELIYVMKGYVRISVLSADGSHDVAELKAGEGAFAPASFFHYIENLEKGDAEIAAFFSHSDPDYIGVGQAVSDCSKEVLASTFSRPVSFFSKFNPPKGPVVIAGG